MVVDISTPLSLPLSLSSLIPPPCAHVVKLTVSASLSDRVFFKKHVFVKNHLQTLRLRVTHRCGRVAAAALVGNQAVCVQQRRHRQVSQTVRR